MAGENKTILQLDNGTLTPANSTYIVTHNTGATSAGKVLMSDVLSFVGGNVTASITASTNCTLTGVLTGNGTSVVARTILGTTSQVIVANGTGVAGNINLSLPQDINTTSTPTFANVKHSGITNAPLVATDANGSLSNVSVSAGMLASNGTSVFGRTLTGTTSQVIISNGDGASGNPTFTLPQDINTTSTPTFVNVKHSGLLNATMVATDANGSLANSTIPTGIVAGNGTGFAGRTILGTTSQVIVSNGTGVAGNINLSLPQDINTTSTPTFVNVKHSGILNATITGTDANGSLTNQTVPTGLVAGTGSAFTTGRTITGTANQIIVSNGDGVSGNPTLSTPQSINTTSSPTFVGLTLSGITNAAFLASNGTGVVMNGTVPTGIVAGNGTAFTAGRTITGTLSQVIVSNGDGVSGNPVLSLPQDINTTSSPTFAGARLTGITNAQFLGSNGTGVVTNGTVPTGMVAGNGAVFTTGRTLTGTTSQVIISNGDGVSGNPTFSLPQDINTTSSPVFAGVRLTGITNAALLTSNGTGVVTNGTVPTGLVAGNGTAFTTGRTITGTANQTIVTNGDGVSGNPTIALPQNINTTNSPTFTNISLSTLANAPLVTWSANGTPQILTLDPGNVSISGGVLYARGAPRPILALTNTSYTLATAHENYFITSQNSSLMTITVPTNANVSINTTTEFEIFNLGTGNVTIAAQSGAVTIHSFNGTMTLVANASLGLKKIGTNTWVMAGYTQ